MPKELPKTYDPRVVEQEVSRLWDAGSYFHAEPPRDGARTFVIFIPPPNVTAALHLGHALNNTLQDILIRFKRMQGLVTLWMPGTDHAGIATQTVVEKRILAEEGIRRVEMGRDEFVSRVQAWKDEYEATILSQLKAMGCSCDWQRTRFTMDPVCAKAVREAFFLLFSDGLIYRGKRLVNWDPATQTVLADDEVEYQAVEGYFWYLRYPLVEPVTMGDRLIEYVTVATTRPETMLGDTAVAVNPSDPRAKALVGKMVRLPLVGRLIPIIADEHVVLPDPQGQDEKARFSTGFLKVTPAHDPDDWQIGQRHGLPVINVLAPDGSISDRHGWSDWQEVRNPDLEGLIGMDRFEAREAVVEWFRQQGLLEDVRPYSHQVGHSYRSHVPIEPYLSDQWYIAVKKPIGRLGDRFGRGLIEGTDVPVNSLAGLALKPLLDGQLRFVPERYAKTYQAWLENLRDWPISRQLWWGHRIPIWSRPGVVQVRQCDAICAVVDQRQDGPVTYVSVRPGHEDLERSLESEGWLRDEDVLDTWFSSALWPFSTLGWPEPSADLDAFYPSDVLCTAREIITLWVSRMVMMGQYCMGQIPFRDVYIHAMIQDGLGRKMSKSLGNGIDPLVIIDSHGADAMRFTLASMTTDTQDIRMPVEAVRLPDGRQVNTSPKFDIGRNFCNKLWNASRFAMMNLEGMDPQGFDRSRLEITDRWILSRLAGVTRQVTEDLESYRFNSPLMGLYRFFWNELCDWYLEWCKPRMADPARKQTTQCVLAFVLDQSLRLLHPFMPFVTEGIFQHLNQICPDRRLPGLAEISSSKALAIAAWPSGLDHLSDPYAEQAIGLVQEVTRVIREIRNARAVAPSKALKVSVKTDAEKARILAANAGLVIQLAGLSGLIPGPDVSKGPTDAVGIASCAEVYVHELIDVKLERERLQRQRQQLESSIRSLEAKLAGDFAVKARPEVVQQARTRLVQLKEQLSVVDRHLAELAGP